MPSLRFVLCLSLAFAALPPPPAFPSDGPVDTWVACAREVARQERAAGIPEHLLAAIALAESGRWSPARKATIAWPWTVTAEGRGHFLPTKQAALAAVRDLQSRGIRNVDVGCMQVNLHYHPNAFKTLEQALDPAANVAYAARFLASLYRETGSWHTAAGRYHSATPDLHHAYRRKVIGLWDEQRQVTAEAEPPPQDFRSTIVPVDYARMARLGALRSSQSTGGSRHGPVPSRLLSRGQRDAESEAEFATRRRQQFQQWRAARAHGAATLSPRPLP